MPYILASGTKDHVYDKFITRNNRIIPNTYLWLWSNQSCIQCLKLCQFFTERHVKFIHKIWVRFPYCCILLWLLIGPIFLISYRISGTRIAPVPNNPDIWEKLMLNDSGCSNIKLSLIYHEVLRVCYFMHQYLFMSEPGSPWVWKVESFKKIFLRRLRLQYITSRTDFEFHIYFRIIIFMATS